MIRRTANKITAAILLAYFVLFIVPPVSSFATEAKSAEAPGNRAAISNYADPQQGVRFLFDIIVWQQFKKTKQSEFLAPVDHLTRPLIDPQKHLQPAWTANQTVSPRPMEMGRITAHTHRQRSSAVRYSRSGTSPPSRLS